MERGYEIHPPSAQPAAAWHCLALLLIPAPLARAGIIDPVAGRSVTCGEGWHTIPFKHTGKATTFCMTLTPPGETPRTKTITLKTNGFIEADFIVPQGGEKPPAG